MGKFRSGKKTAFSVLFLCVVLVLTLTSILHGENIPELIRDIRTADRRYILAAALCVLFYLLMQGGIFHIALKRIMGEKIPLWDCFLLSFHGYFYCSITPFQSGGPPIQILDLKKEGMRYSSASIVVFIVSFLYKLVLCVIGVALLLFGFGFLRRYLRGASAIVFGIGLFLTIGFTFVFWFFLFQTRLTKRFALWCLDRLEKKHILRKNEERRRKVSDALDNYHEASGYFRTHGRTMVFLFFLTLLQRLSFFSAIWFVYRSFGLTGTSYFSMILLQATVNIAADMLPLPGGAGVTEAMYSIMFRGVFPATMLVPAVMMTRGITYYVQLIVCGIFSVVARFMIGKKNQKFLKDRGMTEIDDL